MSNRKSVAAEICDVATMAFLKKNRRAKLYGHLKIGAVFVFLLFGIAYVVPEFYHVGDSMKDLGQGRTALLLGTSKYLVGGGENPYYETRILTAEVLYKMGTVKKIIVSGDSGDEYYNEPKTMRADLMKKGVSAKDIFTDCSGTRTLNSVRRCSEIFNENSPVIISQRYHVKRALMLAHCLGMKADGFPAADPDKIRYRIRNGIREFFARIRAFFDVVYILIQDGFPKCF